MEQTAVLGFGAKSGEVGRIGGGTEGDDETGVTSAADHVTWRRAHEELLRLAEERAGLDFEEGRWLLRAMRAGAHVRLGFGSFCEYTERLFGYGPRLTQEKLRVAEALEELPHLAEELRGGTLSFSAARELTRVATPRTENKWLAAAKGRTVREIEQLVSGHRPGNTPDDPCDPRAKRHVLRFEVSGETLATFREAMAKIRRDAGESLDDDAAILLASRTILEGPREEGRASYQVALTVCEECGKGRQQGRGGVAEVPGVVVEMAACDMQNLGNVDVGAHVGAPSRAAQSIAPAVRRAVLRRDGGRCRVPGCRHATFVDVHHLVPRSNGGSNTSENLVTLCSAHHRGVHRGELVAEGTPSVGIRFSHADGTGYDDPVRGTPSGAHERARRALVAMGYGAKEAKCAVAGVSSESDMSLDELIRAALLALARAA